MLGHFLSNIRHIQLIAEKRGHNIKLNERSRLDLDLTKEFLQKANQGISMNLLTFRKPTNIHICDASEHGMGGFASHGRAWRWNIPASLQGRAHINILEYLAQVVSVWLDIIESTAKNEDCILCMGDNTSAMGWLRRSNFRQRDESDTTWLIKQQIGRHLAHIVLNANVMLYHQWLKGSHNQVADSLSRDAYFLSYKSHKKILIATVPHQLPENFNIKPLPKEITCFLSSMLHKLPESKQWFKQQKPSELAAGNIGILTSIASELTMCSWKESQNNCNIQSYQDLGKQCDKGPSLQEIKNNWWKTQSQPPSHMWHRPLGQTIGQTPDWTLMVKHHISCRNNSEDIKTKTKQYKNKKHSH